MEVCVHTGLRESTHEAGQAGPIAPPPPAALLTALRPPWMALYTGARKTFLKPPSKGVSLLLQTPAARRPEGTRSSWVQPLPLVPPAPHTELPCLSVLRGVSVFLPQAPPTCCSFH